MVHTLFRLLARRILLVIALLTATALSITICPPVQAAMNAIQGGTLPDPLPLLPPNNWWNRDISGWPVAPNSASYISFINNGGTRHLHPDFGGDAPKGSSSAASPASTRAPRSASWTSPGS